MAGPTETITLRMVAQDLMSGNISKVITTFDKLTKQSGALGWAAKGAALSMGAMLNPALLVSNAIGAVVDVMGDATTAFREDQVSQAQLKAALEANIESWDGNTDAIERVIAARTDLGFSDDEQRASLALLVSQVEDVNDALAIQRTAMDLSRLKGIALADASTLLAKAYLGSSTGLQKMGIKLAKGVDGLEAIAAVQERAAGQAEAYGKTSAGATAKFDVKVGELQESIGALLDGPARDFLGFLSGVVDVIDGPQGVERQLQDTADAIYRMGRAADEAAGGTTSPMARMNDEMQKWADTLKLQELNVDPTTFDWLSRLGPDTLRNFGPASADVLARVAAIAHAVQETGGDFSDFGRIIRQEVAPSFNVLTSAWTGSVEPVKTATNEIVHHAGRVRAVPFQMLQSVNDVKSDWQSAWKNLAEWAKNPFRPAQFEKWLGKRADKAIENAKKAAEDGKPGVRRRWQAIAAAMRSPVTAALVNLGMDVDTAIQKVLALQAMAKRVDKLGIVVTGAGGGGAPATYTPGSGHSGGGSGGGGGGRRPGDGPPTGHSLMVNVTVIGSMSEADGARFARTVTPHIQREMSRQGR